MITYGSVCSGIESASIAWEPLGMQPLWFSEIEPFPRAVLRHHWPSVPNLGDMLQLPALIRAGLVPAPDILVGGTPCQAFSVAGKRNSLDDDRGQLTLTYVDILNAIDEQRPNQEAVCVWENVPGVLNTKDNAFGLFLGRLAGSDGELKPPGRKWGNAGYIAGPQRAIAWRTLDAQYFGVAQRRRRVFVVASARTGFDPGTILFECEGVRRDSPPSREAGQEIAGKTEACAPFDMLEFGHYGDGMTASTCKRRDYKGATDLVAVCGDIAHTLRGEGFDASEDGRGTSVVAVATGPLCGNGKAAGSATQQDAEQGMRICHGTQDPCVSKTAVSAKGKNGGRENVLCFAENSRAEIRLGGGDGLRTGALSAGGGKPGQGKPVIASVSAVRRLTPVECERLQGFPDDHTRISWRGKLPGDCPDGPRYRAIGNSKAVPVIQWVGRQLIAKLSDER